MTITTLYNVHMGARNITRKKITANIKYATNQGKPLIIN